jgi:hypothetical protein
VSQRDIYVIDLVNHTKFPEEKIQIFDISESIQVIPIETSDSVLIGNIFSTKIEDNKVFISSINGVFAFDSNGKYQNSIGYKGRGPAEYVSLFDFYPDNDLVWLLDRSGKKVLKYSNSGLFIEGYTLPKQQIFTGFHYLNSSTFIGFVPDNGQPNTNIMLAFFGATGITDSILYRNPIPESKMWWMVFGEASFIDHGVHTKFKHLFNDTLYIIQDYKLKPYTVLNLGTRKANINARAIAADKDPATHNIYEDMDRVFLRGENDRYIFLEIWTELGAPKSVFFYDKKEQTIHKWKFILPEDDRIDHTTDFTPLNIDGNGNLIGYASPANEEDNPIIIIAKLKK